MKSTRETAKHIWDRFHAKLDHKRVNRHGVFHYLHVAFHTVYLGLVFIESHYFYATAAGILGVVVVTSEIFDGKG